MSISMRWVVAALVVLVGAVAWATDMPPAGDYDIYNNQEEKTGSCQFQGEPDATKVIWDNNGGPAEIYLYDNVDDVYKQLGGDHQLEFTDQGNGNYSWKRTQVPRDGAFLFKRIAPLVTRGVLIHVPGSHVVVPRTADDSSVPGA